ARMGNADPHRRVFRSRRPRPFPPQRPRRYDRGDQRARDGGRAADRLRPCDGLRRTQGRPAPAAGWICELAAREGALWGRVEWTPHGAMAIASREYRYISPVFQYTAEGEVMRLLRAGLTNNPNLYLTAISARAAASAGHARDGIMHSLLDELRKLLGLPDEASAEEALAAVRALLSGDADDDAQDAANGEASAEHERGAEGARADG